ncbi:MAG: YlbE-like family protein [Bacilli bacterium]
MILDTQFKIKNNPNYSRYLKENSYWYKYLNRDPTIFLAFEEEVKKFYGLRPQDRISKVLDTVEMVSTIVNNFK